MLYQNIPIQIWECHRSWSSCRIGRRERENERDGNGEGMGIDNIGMWITGRAESVISMAGSVE